jgi:hypothetical protein
MCFSIPRCLWMLIDAIISFDQHSHTHTLYLSLSLCYLALFPHLSVSLKSPLCVCLRINWNTDFTILGCSHFIGSINTKLVHFLHLSRTIYPRYQAWVNKLLSDEIKWYEINRKVELKVFLNLTLKFILRSWRNLTERESEHDKNATFVIMKLIYSAASKWWCLASSIFGKRVATNAVNDGKQWIKVLRALVSPKLV